jgi:hypothetical protein
MKYFSEDEELSMHSFLEVLTVSKLNDSFPIVKIALKLFIYITCSNASGETNLLSFKKSQELPENIII